MLGRSEPACRQLASRARDHVRDNRPRYRAPPGEQARLATAFLDAARTGDVNALTQVLSEQVQMHTDGGGKVKAALNVIHGRDKIIRFLVAQLPTLQQVEARPATINGTAGFIVRYPDGIPRTLAFDFDEAGRIAALYAVANPEKLRGVT